MTRCPACFRRLDAAHRLLGRCTTPGPSALPARSRAGYVPPSRAHRVPWAEYVASRQSTPERKRELARDRQRRRRARLREA